MMRVSRVAQLVELLAPEMVEMRRLQEEVDRLRQRLAEPQHQMSMDLLDFTAGTPLQLKVEDDGRWGVTIALGKHRTGVSGCKDAREAFVRGLEHIRQYYDLQAKELRDCYEGDE
jgi:hypothetical protein